MVDPVLSGECSVVLSYGDPEGLSFRYMLGSSKLELPGIVGRVVDADAAGRLLVVYAGGTAVGVVDVDGSELARWQSSDGLMPLDAAWSPDGSTVAVVASDEVGTTELIAFDTAVGSFDEGVVVSRGLTDGVHPALPVVDRRGRVWYMLVDASSRVTAVGGGLVPDSVAGEVVDGVTGEVLGVFTYGEPVVGQSIDPSGSYLIVTYTDGRVVWRSLDGDSGILADGGYRSADW